MYDNDENIVLWDFDAYDYQKLGMTLDEVINNPNKKMGHAFILIMLLTGKVIASNEDVLIKTDKPKDNNKSFKQETFFNI